MYKLQCQLLWNRTSVFFARRSNIWRSEHNITVVFNERLRVDQAVPCLECALSRQLFERSKVEYDTRCGPIFVTLSHLLVRASLQYLQDVTAATPGR